VDWMRKVMELRASNMSNREYLRNMVEFMPSRLQQVMERGGAASLSYMYPDKYMIFVFFRFINCFIYIYKFARPVKVISRRVYIPFSC
jgi:hypothetical protein